MRKIFLSLCSFVFVSCCLQGQMPSHSTYYYPNLSSLDDISSYLSNMPSSQLHSSSKPKSEMPLTGFFVTVYETSPGLKDLLYVTTHVELQEGGKTQLQDVAGPKGSTLGTRKGQIRVLSQDPKLLVFLHQEDQLSQGFTNVLKILSKETGEMITAQGNEYFKGYVRLERNSPSAISLTN